jgi:arachidonate 15-lipoxygenase
VREAVNGVLAADVAQATVEIQPYAGMAAGDRVDLQWQGNQSGNYTDWLPVSSATVGHVLTFLVPAGQIASNDSVSVSYRVTRATGGTVDTSAILQLRVGETSALPAPTIDEARGGTLDPADAPDGATVRVPAGAGLSAGDLVTVRWKGTQGPGSTEVEHVVSGNDAGHDITVTVPAAVVEASAGSRITLDYTVEYAGGSVGTSEAAVYEIASQAGTGLIKVMGARSQRKGSQHGPVSPVRTLSALNRDTLAPLEASWQYEGESTSLSGVRFRDTQPDRLLHVRTADDHITLSASNINGNAGAMVARRDAGNLVAWGQTANGGTVPPTISTLTDIIEVVSNDSAFAARRANGTVVAWGNTTDGGTVPPTIATLTDIVALAGTSAAFAALRANGTVVAWGATNSGGTVPSEIVTLTDIVTLAGTATAFSALRANGSVVAWGSTTNGGQVPSNIATLTDVVEVTANEYAFAALRANGHVVAWGSTTNGGSVPAEIAVLNDIVEVVPGNVAFAARRANGHVVAWGSASEGGSVPPVIATLDDIVQVTGMHMAFAALRANGHVVAWGDASLGGSVPSTIATLDDIVQVTATSTSSYGAFAALRSNGQVVAWGSSYIGGAPGADIQSQLTDVRAVYCANHAFAALTSDSRVVTWGTAASGGNSSSAQTQLTGQISYEAQPRFAWSESMGPLTGIPMLDAREGDLDAFFHPRAEFTEKLNDVLEKVAANFTHYLTSLIASPTEQQREIICEAALLLQKRNEYILLSGATEQCRQLEQALYARLDELKAYIPDRNAILESGLEHFDAQYRVIDKPFVADFLHEDDLFGYWRVAGNNPVALRGIQALPDNFPLTDEQYRTVMGDDALPLALQEKRIYMLDYHYLADAVAEEGFLKPEDGENSANIAGYSYAAMALFAVSKTTGKLMPVAIQCGQIPSEDTPLLLPTNGWGWEMAKYVINAADESEHQLASHLGLTHLLCEAFSLATVRNFQEEHPLYRLLISHFEGTNRINHNAISALLEPYKFVDQLFAAPLDKLLKKVVDARMTYDFSEHFLPKALENRGVNDTKALPDYPYRDDGLLIWNAIAEWVSSYINHYYITNDDIIQDSALMAWVNDIIANGKVKGFRSISTKDELRDTLTMIIFTTSAQHAAVNFTQPAWMMYAPSVCGTLAAPRPESVNKTHADWLNMLPGLLRAASKINIYTTLGEVYHGYLGEYIGWNGEDIFDPVSEPVIYSYLEDFRNKLSEINTIIEERNKTRPYSYPFLMPKNIPASINI